MDRDRQPVDSGGQVVARAAVHIDGHIVALGSEAVADVPLADAAESDEPPPSLHVGIHQQGGIALFSLRGKAEGVDHQGRFIRERGAQDPAGRKVDQTVFVARGVRIPVEAGESFQEPGEFAPQDVEEMAALLGAGRVDEIVEHGQGLDRYPDRAGVFGVIGDDPAGGAYIVITPCGNAVAKISV